MSEKLPKPEELSKVDYRPRYDDWMKVKADFRKGTYSYQAAPKK